MEMLGNLNGVATKVETFCDGELTEIEVLAQNGVTCYVADHHGATRKLHVNLGSIVCLEEADLMFTDGRMVYQIDEKLRCVAIKYYTTHINGG